MTIQLANYLEFKIKSIENHFQIYFENLKYNKITLESLSSKYCELDLIRAFNLERSPF